MVNEDFSCIKEVTKIVNLTLPSMYNTNEISGISDALENWKRQYVKQLQGIVVGYKNVSLTSKRGYLKADCPIIYCNVKATFELFYPTIGSVIKGKINRISQDHIGCLVHDTINVTVHQTDDISSDISKFIVLDNFILFQITRINFKSKFIHVKGKITEECITLMNESSLFSANVNACDNSVLTYASPDFSSRNNSRIVYDNPITSNSNTQKSSEDCDFSTDTSSQSSSHTKKKKHKKSNENFTMTNSLISGFLENDISQVELIQSSKKTKKKKHKTSDVNLTLLTSALENEIEPIHKKNKMKSEEHLCNDLNQDELTQSSDNTRKRKRKKSYANLASPTNALRDEMEPIHSKKKIKLEEQTISTNDTIENFGKISNILTVNPASSSQNIAVETANCTIKAELLSPVKKKKHKKSKTNLEASSSFSDHAVRTEMKPVPYPDISSPKTLPSSHKKFEEGSLTSLDLFHESLNQVKSETKLVKEKSKKKKQGVSNKNKAHKKKKDKLKKSSKKDKKKKVISSKKKLHGHSVKLKKKSRIKNAKKNKKGT